MDTFAVYNLKKTVKYSLLFCSFFLFTACPGEEDCFDLDRITRVADLILLTPEQTEYNQGDVLTLKIDLPATNTFFGEELNLFDVTSAMEARLRTNSAFFEGNTLAFVKGRQGESSNKFYLLYNPDNDTYELEFTITLDRTGDYSVATLDDIIIKGADDCNRHRIDTNVLWAGDALVEFTVNE